MGYGTLSTFRRVSGITVDEMSDSEVQEYLSEADRVVLEDLTVRVRLEELLGQQSDSNVVFRTLHAPIADSNLDKTIDTSDIEVYGWSEDTYGRVTLTQLTVSEVLPELGVVILSTAPSGYDKIVANYRYYLCRYPVDWSLVEMASVYYACYLAHLTLKGLIPPIFRLGSLSVSWGRSGEDKPHVRFYELYKATVRRLIGAGYIKSHEAPKPKYYVNGEGI